MQGPIPWWDQPPDSRDNTVSMPRVDPAEFVDRQSGAESAGPDDRRAMPERPALGDPYALPAQSEQAWPAQPTSGQQPARWLKPEQRPTQWVPDFEPAASFGPEAAAPLEPEAAELPDGETDAPLEPEAADAPEPEAAAAPEPAVAAALEPAVAAAPKPVAAPRVEPAATEPAAGLTLESAAWTTSAEAPADRTAVERAETAAPAEATTASAAKSVPAVESEHIAPVAADREADRSWRDAESAQPAAAASLAPPARSAPRPTPPREASPETSLGEQSVPARAADRPAAGSLADLRGRLARLPAGHPASPYDDTGRPKPAPTRLRMLELGLPARPAGVASYTEPPGFDHDEQPDDVWPDAAAATVNPVSTARAASDTARRSAAERDTVMLPPASEHSADAAGDDRRNGSATAQSPASDQNGRGRSVPADWQHPYDVPGDSDHRRDHKVPLDRTDVTTASWPTVEVPPRNGDHRNGNRAGALRDPTAPDGARRQAQRSQPWPTDPDQPMFRPPAAERPNRPAVTNRLSAAQHELVDRILASCRAAEGRNAVGGYGSSGLTPAMMRIAAQLPFGGLAPGSEADTLKSADRLAAKLARLIARQPGRSAEQVAAGIGDVIRYAFTFDSATYTEGTLLVHRKLKTQGFELEARRNRWGSPEYKGVFTRWRDPAHGLPFEVQFHTGQSWTFVKRTHETYVRITDPVTSPAERANLRAQQATAAEVVLQPPGCAEIDDFRAGARGQPR